MSKKCPGCHALHEDHVVYCPNCGTKVEKLPDQPTQTLVQPETYAQPEPPKKKINWIRPAFNEKLLELPFIEWLPLILAVVGLVLAWEVYYLFALFLGVMPLCILYQNKQVVDFKAPMITKVIAVMDLVLFVLCFCYFAI